MSKYIDADRLKQAVEHELDMQDLYLPVHFFEVVDGMESADVVQRAYRTTHRPSDNMFAVVRCMDCVHYEPLDSTRPWDCPVGISGVCPNDYCSKGERKDG